MSNMTIEVVEQLPSLDDSVPCELYAGYSGLAPWGYQCGRPAVVRVRLSCPECRHAGLKFLCQPCFDELPRGNIRHAACQNIASTWTES